MRPSAAVLVAIVLALAAAGCGGSGPDAMGKIRALTRELFGPGNPDARTECSLLTTPLVTAIYGGREQCVKAPHDPSSGEVSTASAIRVAGDRATGRIAVRGGAADGTAGGLTFAKEDGAWKLASFGPDLMHSLVNRSLAQADFKGLAGPGLRTCMSAQAAKLTDAQVRDFFFAALRHDPSVTHRTFAFAEACPGPLNAVLASQMVATFKKADSSARDARCFSREIKKVLAGKRIPQLLLEGKDVKKPLQTLFNLAGVGCVTEGTVNDLHRKTGSA